MWLLVSVCLSRKWEEWYLLLENVKNVKTKWHLWKLWAQYLVCKRYSINGVSFILKVRTEARILNSVLQADLDPCKWAKWNSLYLQVRSALPAEVNNLVCGEPGGFWGTGLWPPDREHQRGSLADNRVELSDFSYIGFYLSFYVITTSVT